MTKPPTPAGSAVIGDVGFSETASDLGKRLRTDAMWVLVGRALGIGATILATLVLARVLSPAEFGAFGLLTSILSTSSVVAMCGLNMVVVRYLAESLATNDYRRAVRVLRIASCIAGTAILIVSLSLMAILPRYIPAIHDASRPFLICSLSAIISACLACNNLMAATLRGFDEQRLATFLGPQHSGGPLGASIFFGFLLLVAAQLMASLEVVLLLYAVAYLVSLPVAIFWLRNVIRKRSKTIGSVPTKTLIEFTPRIALSAGFVLMLTQVLSLAMRDADLWIVGSFGQEGDLELFVAARRIVQIIAVPLGLINLSVITMIPTLLSEGRLADLQRVLRSAANMAGVVSGLCAIAVLLVPQLILRLLLGPYYEAAALPLMILCFGQLVFTWAGPCEMVLMMTGHERWAFAINAISTGAIFVGGPYIIRHWGIVGLATFSSSVVAAQHLVQWFVVFRLTGLWTHASPFIGHWRNSKR